MNATAVVVMEPGSEWPTGIEGLTNVVGLGSLGEDLLLRTRAKLDVFQRREFTVSLAVLACSTATCGDLFGSRATLARALLGAVTGTASGRLILSARNTISRPLRRELVTLAARLVDESRGTTATVALWFTEPAHGAAPRLVAAYSPEGVGAARRRPATRAASR